MNSSDRYPGPGALRVALLALAWLAATSWVRPLLLPDEGRYVGVAYEMLRSGDWWTPTLNGMPFFHKPPLFYWITAAAMSTFGLHDAAGRVASILGAWAAAMSLWWFVRRWCNERVATMTLLALLAQPLVYVGGQFANLDMLVAGCITVSIVTWADVLLRDPGGDAGKAALAAGWIAMGLGVLAKGLIGVVIPVLVIAAAALLGRRGARLWKLAWWPGIALFVAITAPWFVVMQLRYPDFLHYFFVVQHFDRYAAGGFNNVQPIWFYGALLTAFCLPWLPWLWRAAGRLDSTADASSNARFVRMLMWVWTAAVVVFFSLPRSKLVGYILPAVPPLACLAALGFASLRQPTRGQRFAWAGGLALLAVLGLGAVAWFGLSPQKSSLPLAQAIRAQPQHTRPVFMLGRYDYDVPLYARLRDGVIVVDDWSSPGIRRSDNWRKELLEAGDFAPTRAAELLLEPGEFESRLCSAGSAWVIGGADSEKSYPLLAAARTASVYRGVKLWSVDESMTTNPALCRETPRAGLPSTSPAPRSAAPAQAPPGN